MTLAKVSERAGLDRPLRRLPDKSTGETYASGGGRLAKWLGD
jgi:hypothetical protein